MLKVLSDGKTQQTGWGYDIYGRQTSKTNAAGSQILTYGYNANGNLTTRWSTTKGTTTYEYTTNRLTKIDYPSSTDVTFAYDALNRLTNMVDASGTTTNAYDVANRISIENGPWSSDTVTNTLNLAGLRSAFAIEQPTSYFNTAYTYDSAKRLSTVASGAGTSTYYYHPGLGGLTNASRLVHQLTLPNTSIITNYYDTVGRLTNTLLETSSGTDRNLHRYVYNLGGQRTRQDRFDGSYVNYTYDDASELRTAEAYTSGGSAITTEQLRYGYDPAWNMLKRTNHTTVTTYTVNNLNQVTASGTPTYAYDGNGNRTSMAPGTGSVTYTYDDENQVIRAETDTVYTSIGNRWKTEFTYDGKQRLRKKVEYLFNGSGGTTWGTGTETRYVYDGMLIVQERGSSNPSVTYTRGNDLSGTIQGAGGIGGLISRSSGYNSGTGAWSTRYHYHADAIGNITGMFDNTTNAVTSASYTYDPFGRTLTSSGTISGSNLMRFSSKPIHANTGFYYYGYRWYDPNTQKWLNRDPIGEEGGLNLYAFCTNDPISRQDPLGLTSLWGILQCSKLPKAEQGKCLCNLTPDVEECEKKIGNCLSVIAPGKPSPAAACHCWCTTEPDEKKRTQCFENCDKAFKFKPKSPAPPKKAICDL